MRYRNFFVCVVMVLLIAGCGGDENGDDYLIPGGGTPPPPPSPSSATVKIAAGASGQVSKDGLTVKVESGTFPLGATVTFGTSTPSEVPQGDELEVISGKSQVIIECTQVPQKDLILEVPAARFAGDRGLVSELFVAYWDNVWKTVSVPSSTEGSISVKLGRDAFNPFKRIAGVVARALISPVDSTAGLIEHSSDPGNLPNVAVLVHGFNSNAGAMKLLADQLKTKNVYGKILVFGYDWRRQVQDSGQRLATELAVLSDQGAIIDIYAHSMGVLVSRYAMEKADATRGVENLFAIAGANKGSYLANTERFVTALRNDYLNLPNWARNQGAFAMMGISSVADLIPESALLSSLNTPNLGHQRGSTNYYCYGVVSDLVVGKESGVATGLPLEQITAGAVSKRSVAAIGSHSSMLKNSTEANWFIDQFISRRQPTSEVTFYDEWYRELTDIRDIDSACWMFQAGASNNSGSNIHVLDVSLDVYDRYGNWQYCRYVGSFGGKSETYLAINETCCDGRNWTTHIFTVGGDLDPDHTWLMQCAPQNQAHTIVIRVRIKEESGYCSCLTKVYRCYWVTNPTTIWPSTPVLRSG